MPQRILLQMVTLVIALSLFSASGICGPVYDPFLEEFQVGAFGQPDKVPMDGIWPADLFEPVQLDLTWVESARSLFFPGSDQGEDLTHRFLGKFGTSPMGNILSLRESFEQLENPALDADAWKTWVNDHPYLREEVWTRLVFHHHGAGRTDQALLLMQHWNDLGFPLSDRKAFIWKLRRLSLTPESEIDLVSVGSDLKAPWKSGTGLGPFDRAQVWSLWVAHRKAVGLSILPSSWSGKEEALLVASLSRPYFTREDLEASSFSREMKAGLGATLFQKQELADHLAAYPAPPSDFSAQGWWVKGMRFHHRGQADHYEKLATRSDLKSGWRMDVLRRASEIRLIDGQWGQGLRNLKQALDIAEAEGGTLSQRRLVRYWLEQALALAVDDGREDTAWQMLDWGDKTFKGESLAVWKDETAYWRALRTGDRPVLKDLPTRAEWNVAAGEARPVEKGDQGPTLASRSNLGQSDPSHLWQLWMTWGISLANPDPLVGERRERAIRYSSYLEKHVQDSTGDLNMPQAALEAVSDRFQDRPELLEPLMTKVIDRDICALADWETTPRPSPIPSLLTVLRRSQLDMHAALGFALATGDMRGILALAYEIPGSSLTQEEKRRFLYPLPAEGPIKQAILAAKTEPALILAVARNESLFEPAVRSRAGALGWMQIMPFHFQDRGAKPGHEHWAMPAVSIGKGDQLLEENRRRYDGDPYLTLAAYNAGPGATDRWLRQLGGDATPEIYLAWIGYTETRRYVEKVLIDREIYDWILTGQP